MLFIGLTYSCTNEKIEPIDTLPVNVSLSNDIIPMFNTYCNTAACHDGTVPPDLSAANAYDVMMNDPDLVNTANPEQSELYVRMIDQARPMPLTGVLPYESSQVLSWIKDGAPNN
jgi:hypothetical protein